VAAVPLVSRIHEGLVFSNRDSRTLLDKLLRPSKSRVNHPLINPVSLRIIGKTLPDVAWDANAKE
jgi:hypothetical protein